jgi:hypothetical protein
VFTGREKQQAAAAFEVSDAVSHLCYASMYLFIGE